MSSNEPPAGSVPPPGEPTPPPPPAPAASTPPPPPPPAGAAAPAPGAPPAPGAGVGQPGTLLDRFLARLIDGVILGVTYGILTAIVGGAIITGYRSGSEVYFYYLIIGVLSGLIYLGYFAYMESSRGQTVGKIVMKLKVTGPDGHSNPTMEQAVKRNIYMAAGLIAIIPFVGWFLSYIAEVAALILILVGINGDPRRQHWFDKFAGGTQVTKIG